MKKIIITIPAYNEEQSIGEVVSDIKKVMSKEKHDFKILVVNDGSNDKTEEVAKKNGAIVVSHPRNYGLAEAFRTELKECLRLKAEIIVHTDADGQYLAEDIPKLIKEVENGYDLVLGNRFEGGIEEMPLLKKLGNKAFSNTISKIIRQDIGDCQTGFRAFTRKVAEKIEIKSDHTYTQEQIIRCANEMFRIKEIPTYFRKRNGESRLMRNPFEYALKAWINILRIYRDYQPLKFFGAIGLFFFSVGVLIGLMLVLLFLTTGKIGHLPLTILSIMLVIIGVQIGLFGFLADMKR
ncbi:glycosyltransferase family 2 protein [Candidatus Woesearchaeota archaeon]|nr:glycosyltransferase family 2 protein [Candidatus Woesearchaeota archaeon]